MSARGAAKWGSVFAFLFITALLPHPVYGEEEEGTLEEWLELEKRIDSLLATVDELEALMKESDLCEGQQEEEGEAALLEESNEKERVKSEDVAKLKRAYKSRAEESGRKGGESATPVGDDEVAERPQTSENRKEEVHIDFDDVDDGHFDEEEDDEAFSQSSSQEKRNGGGSVEAKSASSSKVSTGSYEDYESYYDDLAKRQAEEKKRRKEKSQIAARREIKEKRFGLKPLMYCKACEVTADELADAIARASEARSESGKKHEVLNYEGKKKRVARTEMVLEHVLEDFCKDQLKNYVPTNSTGAKPTQAVYKIDEADRYSKASYDLYDTTTGFGGTEKFIGYTETQMRQGYLSNLGKLQKGLIMSCEAFLEEYDQAIAGWYFGGGGGTSGPKEKERKDLRQIMCRHEGNLKERDLDELIPQQVAPCYGL